MKVSHYVTYDRGQGPVSFVEIENDTNSLMLRINHKARFNKMVEVDVEAVKEALAQETDLGSASTVVPNNIKEDLTELVLFWIEKNGHQERHLYWKNDGEAALFVRAEERDAWVLSQAFEPEKEELPKKRKMIMG